VFLVRGPRCAQAYGALSTLAPTPSPTACGTHAAYKPAGRRSRPTTGMGGEFAKDGITVIRGACAVIPADDGDHPGATPRCSQFVSVIPWASANGGSRLNGFLSRLPPKHRRDRTVISVNGGTPCSRLSNGWNSRSLRANNGRRRISRRRCPMAPTWRSIGSTRDLCDPPTCARMRSVIAAESIITGKNRECTFTSVVRRDHREPTGMLRDCIENYPSPSLTERQIEV